MSVKYYTNFGCFFISFIFNNLIFFGIEVNVRIRTVKAENVRQEIRLWPQWYDPFDSQ